MSEIAGCGIDIEELARFSRHLPVNESIPDLWHMISTEEEISINRQFSPHVSFPLSFSCKEAMFKALGRSWTNSNISWKEIELIFQDHQLGGDFLIRLSGHALARYRALNCTRIESAFSFTDDYVIFQIILHS